MKRTNAFLAWSGCIDHPGADLCTPDNLEDKFAAQIQAIRDKWKGTPPPPSFGPRPENQQMCTSSVSEDDRGQIFGDKVTFTVSVQGSIPAGHGYVPGSAQIVILASDTPVSSSVITSQPSPGSTGSVSFGTKVEVENKFWNKEWVRFQVCFTVTTPAAAAYDNNVDNWRNEQAEEEILALLAAETEKLESFLLSDRIGPTIQRKIFEKFFGAQSNDDCCALVKRVNRIFDFEKLGFELLPKWNDMGTGCQSTEPVTIYSAKCLNFYVPVKPGKEWEALGLLKAINVLPNSSSLTAQIAGYINSIIGMRDTLFNRVFDPTGWETQIDGPNGYQLTSYDVATNAWEFPAESSLNYQLIDVTVVTVPCPGERKELRPNAC